MVARVLCVVVDRHIAKAIYQPIFVNFEISASSDRFFVYLVEESESGLLF